MRRTGGAKAMREVFKIARSDDRCSHHVFVAAALMELSTAKNGDKVRVVHGRPSLAANSTALHSLPLSARAL